MSTGPNTQPEPTAATASGDDGGPGQRRWYHPRPSPRCAADVAGFHWSYWLFITFVVLFLLLPW
jgi:hypothetical protein